MAINMDNRRGGEGNSRYVLVGALIIFAFFASYTYAASSRSSAANNPAYAGGGLAQAGNVAGGAGGGAVGGGCCGGGGAPVEAATKVEGNVQKLTIDTSQGSFNPNTIKAKAGVPLELTFTQAAGGCLSGVLFPDFNINQDLTAGQQTIKLPALQKGEYQFSCQMQMVTGKIVVE